MELSQASDRASAGNVVRSDDEIPQIPRRWLVLVRAAWVVTTILAVTLFVASLPAYYDQLRTACIGSACISHQLTPEGVRSLRELGLSVGFYATYSVALAVLFTGACLVIAAVIFWRAPEERIALLGALMLVLFGVVFPETPRALAHSLWHWPVSVVGFLGFVSAVLFINLFPSGRFVPHWTRWTALVWITVAGQGIFFPDSTDQPWMSLLNTLGFVCAASASLGALVYRYLRKADQAQRQQVKWVVFGITTGLGGIVGVTLLGVIFPTLGPPSLFDALGVRSAQIFLLLLIPLSIGVAILRYRLWDIDIIINRTLVYGALTTFIVSVYVLMVGGLGILLQSRGNPAIALLATGLIAVLFAPLRDRLQRGVNRLMYGERDDPYGVLSRLGQRLKTADAPEAVLPTIVETVAGALKLPYAAISLRQDDDGTFGTVAASGHPKGEPLVLPLSYGTETIGRLILSPRSPGEQFGPADRRLLDGIARHAEAAAYAVRLTADLQRSRERLVNAREEERRRLRRDLHDGLGPQLATLTLKLDAARNLLSQEPKAADTLLTELKTETKAAISDIRRLVYDLRPPALDELGLIPAIREQATNYGHDGLNVSVEAPKDLPPLPAAVEVAAYRIAQEALTNVVHHAKARACHVRLSVGDGLELEITDDGVGLPEDRHAGVGLSSMRERSAELGGTFVAESAPEGGTRVLARLPLQSSGVGRQVPGRSEDPKAGA